jgi:hypothetical protein
LVDDKPLHTINVLLFLKPEIEFLRKNNQRHVGVWIKEITYAFTQRLIGGIVPHLKVWMTKRLFARDSLGRVEAEHPRQQVKCERVRMRIERGEWYPGLDG